MNLKSQDFVGVSCFMWLVCEWNYLIQLFKPEGARLELVISSSVLKSPLGNFPSGTIYLVCPCSFALCGLGCLLSSRKSFLLFTAQVIEA